MRQFVYHGFAFAILLLGCTVGHAQDLMTRISNLEANQASINASMQRVEAKVDALAAKIDSMGVGSPVWSTAVSVPAATGCGSSAAVSSCGSTAVGAGTVTLFTGPSARVGLFGRLRARRGSCGG